MHDVMIIGAGAIGLASALALSRRGLRVVVIERSAPGAGASGTAAGVLGTQMEIREDGPLGRLCVESLRRWPAFAAGLVEQTGIDIGYRPSGGLNVAYGAAELHDAAAGAEWAAPLGLPVERLDAAGARALEPALSAEIAGAVHYRADARVDPPAFVRALAAAAANLGVEIREGAPARQVAVERGRAAGVRLEDGSLLPAGKVILAAGSWSALVEGTGLEEGAVEPVRGQMLELLTDGPAIRRVIYGPGCYLSPRDDGRVLLGSTLERVGFRSGVTAGAAQALLAAAIRLVPALSGATLSRSWSCFRPCARDELPLIGPTAIQGLLLATGHYRNGVVLSAITAEIVAALVEGAPPPVALEPFLPARMVAR